MLSCFSHVRLFVTPWTGAHQVSLSVGFSRQEYWSGFVISFSRGTSLGGSKTTAGQSNGIKALWEIFLFSFLVYALQRRHVLGKKKPGDLVSVAWIATNTSAVLHSLNGTFPFVALFISILTLHGVNSPTLKTRKLMFKEVKLLVCASLGWSIGTLDPCLPLFPVTQALCRPLGRLSDSEPIEWGQMCTRLEVCSQVSLGLLCLKADLLHLSCLPISIPLRRITLKEPNCMRSPGNLT